MLVEPPPLPKMPLPVLGASGVAEAPGPGVFSPRTTSVVDGVGVLVGGCYDGEGDGVVPGVTGVVGVALGEGDGLGEA